MAEQITWTSADGATVIDLTNEAAGYRVAANGTAGLRSVSYEMVTTRYAGIDGETVNVVHVAPTQPLIGLLVAANGEADLRAKIRGLVHAMRPKAGPGTLTVANEEGERRSLTCYCIDGLPGAEDPSSILVGSWWKVALKFYAADPWWLGDAPEPLSVGLGVGSNFFPIFPLALAPSTVQGQFTVDLTGTDTPAFPVWTITGPGSSLVLTNTTTGRSITVNTTLAAGQSLTIDTRPGLMSVRRNDGTNLLGSVAGYPDLWPLIEDINVITAQLTGATTASRIVGSYQPRYAGI